jgi:hypothetical protein
MFPLHENDQGTLYSSTSHAYIAVCQLSINRDLMTFGVQVLPFERLLFRATRGNMFLKHSVVGAVTDPITGDKQEKAVFTVFFAGERARLKILKVRSHTLWYPRTLSPLVLSPSDCCACCGGRTARNDVSAKDGLTTTLVHSIERSGVSRSDTLKCPNSGCSWVSCACGGS